MRFLLLPQRTCSGRHANQVNDDADRSRRGAGLPLRSSVYSEGKRVTGIEEERALLEFQEEDLLRNSMLGPAGIVEY